MVEAQHALGATTLLGLGALGPYGLAERGQRGRRSRINRQFLIEVRRHRHRFGAGPLQYCAAADFHAGMLAHAHTPWQGNADAVACLRQRDHALLVNHPKLRDH